jgi:serine/threonine protein kinase
MASGDSSDTDLVPVSARAPQPEQRLFGRFTLKRVLGRGGMGIVWLAEDEELQRNVAMKFLPDMLIRDPDAVKDLKRETRRSLDLTHHHIVRIYDFIQDDASAAIVMEYVDGESLSGMKSKQAGGCFGPSEIAHWVAHFCLAMDYAHNQARVVHRDLKPANLMVNSRSELKVTDFGISRSLSDSMTRVSLANNAGTLAYMSPEQALGSPPAPADDIYAFGATLYDLLTGRPPFFRGNLQVQLETVMPPPLMQRRRELDNTGEDIPSAWEEVIMACLSKSPEDRPKTLGEVGHRLGILGITGARSAPTAGVTDTSRATTPATTATTIPSDATPTMREQSPAVPQSPGSARQNTAPRHHARGHPESWRGSLCASGQAYENTHAACR